MTEPASQLLALLGSGVRPFDATAASAMTPNTPDFGLLLARARSGNPETGLEVKLTADLERLVDVEQRKALAGAVDRAAVVGAQSALVLLDERIVRVDVRTRMVVEEIARSDLDPVEGIDVFVQTPQESLEAEVPTRLPSAESGMHGSARGVRNASLVRALNGDAS